MSLFTIAPASDALIASKSDSESNETTDGLTNVLNASKNINKNKKAKMSTDRVQSEIVPALREVQLKLPHGDNGRTVNSFIFPNHPDALAYQRNYRVHQYTKLKSVIPAPFQLRKEAHSNHCTYLYFKVNKKNKFSCCNVQCCNNCHQPLNLYVESGVKFHLRISDKNAASWQGLIPIGFRIKITDCNCYNSDSDEGFELDEGFT